ncbi:MAG: hypothetical protein JXA69_21510 [Phycisphaerae bacterium]|nr:hypothetical protein [Phycisphaerae bacterium]
MLRIVALFVLGMGMTTALTEGDDAEPVKRAAEKAILTKIQFVQLDSASGLLSFPPDVPRTDGVSYGEAVAAVNDPLVVLVDPASHPAGLGVLLVDPDKPLTLGAAAITFTKVEEGSSASGLVTATVSNASKDQPGGATRLLFRQGEPVDLFVGQERPNPIQSADGSVNAATAEPLPSGVEIRVLADKADGEAVSFASLHIRRTYSQVRMRVAPVPFESALGVTTAFETTLSLVLPANRVAVFKLPGPADDRPVLAILSAMLVE